MVEYVLTIPAVDEMRARMGVAGSSTVLAAACEWARAADRRTGRDVALAHSTVAKAIRYAEATVKRIMRFLSRLGLIVECARGANRLTLEQLAVARELGASAQRAVASTRALTIPSSVVGTPLPPTQQVLEKSHVVENSSKRARSTRKVGATRRPQPKKEGRRARREVPRVIAVQELAGRLTEELPWLAQGRHVGRVCSLIERLKLVERGWTRRQILDRINAHMNAKRIPIVNPAEQHDPLSYFAWMLRAAIPVDEIAPQALASAERRERLSRQAAERAAEAVRRDRIAAESEAIEAAIAAMRQQFPRSPKPSRVFV